MKEFIEKLIKRLNEKSKWVAYGNRDRDIGMTHKVVPFSDISDIVNKLAEEYENDFCEWKVDGVYLMCQHKTELFVSCLEDEKYRYKHCPICGKKIKAVE